MRGNVRILGAPARLAAGSLRVAERSGPSKKRDGPARGPARLVTPGAAAPRGGSAQLGRARRRRREATIIGTSTGSAIASDFAAAEPEPAIVPHGVPPPSRGLKYLA